MSNWKPRNPYAMHPLMRKGKKHGRTKKAKRKQDKQALEDEIEEAFADDTLKDVKDSIDE